MMAVPLAGASPEQQRQDRRACEPVEGEQGEDEELDHGSNILHRREAVNE
jgi:hypothetical protein